MHKDRSRYRNVIFLFLTLMNTVSALFVPFKGRSVVVMAVVFIAFLLLILLLPFMLIANGIVMIQREGRNLANRLSLLLGIAVLIGEVSLISVVVLPYIQSGTGTQIMQAPLILMMIGASVVYGSLTFASFAIYTVFLQLIPHKRDFDYIIIHGSGLIGGNSISKLLSDRLDKAIRLYSKDPTPPIMIPSGWKGADESVAKADAMGYYLVKHGIPESQIIREDQSMTTFENLANSKRIIDSRPGRKYSVLVTSNYHLYRALRYCRKLGFRCTGVGAHVAMYYWPSALIREFVAVHREKKHLAWFIAGWALVMLPLLILAFIH